MRSEHSGLVYCSITGFASDDPRADLHAYEGVVGAATATFLETTSDNAQWPGTSYWQQQTGRDRPAYTAIPTASAYGAFQAAASIAMALYFRELKGVGQYIEVPLFDSMFATNAFRGRSYNDPTKGITYPYTNGKFGEPKHYGHL